MSTPVKTTLMEAIGDALEGITAIEEIVRDQAVPTDEETQPYPWACYFDETETKENRNRTAQKSFDLVVQIWVREKKDTTIRKQLEEMDAEVEKALLTDTGILDATRGILPTSSEKFYVSDGRGILQTVFRVTYVHAWKDPYDPAKGS